MPLRLYYLDDEPDLLDVFSEIFACPELEIVTCSDPVRALQEIQANPPDILFLDYRLPRTTGDQIALQVDAAIPKALVTGDVRVTLQARFDAVFEKPFPVEKMQEFIQAQIQRLNSSK
ncbi:MAG: hypothetical protein RJB38_951 [Pseudomonadota bacterium]|jgi:DNA-binding response OmpR family regulator